MKKSNHYIICAGGTGGHFFPAIATAEFLIQSGHKVTLLTDKRTANYASKKHVETIKIIPLINRSFSGNFFQKVISCFFLSIGLLQAFYLLIKLKPHKLIGFGGYPSFPGIMAGIILNIPIILHDQNTILGRVNKILGRFAQKIAVSYPIDFMKKLNHFPEHIQKKLIYTGNPIREIFLKTPPNKLKISKTGPIQIFIFGGSQGARIFSEKIPEQLKNLNSNLKKRIKIIQQARAEDIKNLEIFYKKEGIFAKIQPFFDKMETILQNSHLVIARSGASSITEICVTKTPAIYIPLPTAKDNHQFYNAQYVCENLNAGWLIEQKNLEQSLTPLLEKILLTKTSYSKVADILKKHRYINSLGREILC